MNKAVIFDMDGVIFDSETIVMDCWRILSERYNFPDFETVYEKCIGVNTDKSREIFKNAYGQDFPYDFYRGESSKLFREKSDNGLLPIKKGTVELLEFLKANDYLIGLASSTREEVVHKELKAASLFHYFDSITCGDQVKNSKPDPEIYLKACNSLNINPATTYAIEDSHNGIISAHKAGMITIMVPDLIKPDETIKAMASYIFPDLTKVKNFLENI